MVGDIECDGCHRTRRTLDLTICWVCDARVICTECIGDHATDRLHGWRILLARNQKPTWEFWVSMEARINGES